MTVAVPVMPFQAPPVKAACRRQMNEYVPVCVSVRDTGAPPGNTTSETLTRSGPVGLGSPPGGTSHTSWALPALAPKRHVMLSPALRLTAAGVHSVPLASTSTFLAGAGSSADSARRPAPGRCGRDRAAPGPASRS